MSIVVGIDLGTTNSEVAAYVDGRVRVLGPKTGKILPSCVGVAPDGQLLIGEAALNQQRVYPERTVRSIKRKMGGEETVTLAGKSYRPQEISALILKELASWASNELGQPVSRAVITVPAYFSDAQRTATREAGMLAGLEVMRILNEPTAASLAYGFADGMRHTVLVYDLGGGTFDVSVVTIEGEVTEVLSSHGNNRLGGDDFDDLLAAHLEREFTKRHGVQLGEGNAAARARLWWAAESAKKQLSFEPYAKVREEALFVRDGEPLHLDVEVSRTEYEAMILPLVESTLESVSKALADAGKNADDLYAILLIGGSTRTPLVSRLLTERTGVEPRQDVHPDLGVALGAGVLASRLAGHDVDRVLVDVSPYSFGPSYLGERGGYPYPHCYHPLIRRNTPLPVTRTESYYTSPHQTRVNIEIFQGEDSDALNNILVGEFKVEGLSSVREMNEVLCRMSLDLEGILHVSAIEKRTGKTKQITISGALKEKSKAEIEAARRRLDELFEARKPKEFPDEAADFDDDGNEVIDIDAKLPLGAGYVNGKPNGTIEHFPVPSMEIEESVETGDWVGRRRLAVDLLFRSKAASPRMHEEDRQEAESLGHAIEAAVARREVKAFDEALRSLDELLFFVEGS